MGRGKPRRIDSYEPHTLSLTGSSLDWRVAGMAL
jgi:hypothetical protein